MNMNSQIMTLRYVRESEAEERKLVKHGMTE